LFKRRKADKEILQAIEEGRALEDMVNHSQGWQIVKKHLEENKDIAQQALVDEENLEQIRIWQHNIRYYYELIGFIEEAIKDKNDYLERFDID